MVGNYTYHFLDIVPKDKGGNPASDLATLRVDSDKTIPGIQELKEWQGMIEYVQSFKDNAGDGLPDVPGRYRSKQGRILVNASWNPLDLVSRAALPTILAILILGAILIILIASFALIIRKRKVKKQQVN